MHRVFFRCSLDGADGNTTNAFRQRLEDAGFEKVGTSAYEHAGISAADLASALSRFWSDVQALPQGVRVDHVWMYVAQV